MKKNLNSFFTLINMDKKLFIDSVLTPSIASMLAISNADVEKKYEENYSWYIHAPENKDSPQEKLWFENYGNEKLLYSTDNEIFDLIRSFNYSNNFLMAFLRADIINKYFKDISTNSVLDFCGGSGLNTIYLKKIFPEHKVYYHNYDATTNNQMMFAKDVSTKLNTNILFTTDLVEADILVMFESFEHSFKPIVWLIDVLAKVKPKIIIEHQSFSLKSSGHYYKGYNVDDKVVTTRRAAGLFSKKLKENGFVMVWAGWNGSPRVWIKNTTV